MDLHRVVVFLAFLPLSCRTQQLPIPPHKLGFEYQHNTHDAPVQVDMFIDVLCPDSKAAHPVLTSLAQEYAPDQFKLVFHLFPLPYHQHAFTAAQTVMAVSDWFDSAHALTWINMIYHNQYRFSNAVTANTSASHVAQILSDLVQQTFLVNASTWDTSLAKANAITRVAWKYACARGVTGTPVYFVNGMPLTQAEASWTLGQWKAVIDPLLLVGKTPAVVRPVLVMPRRPVFRLDAVAAQRERCAPMDLHACDVSTPGTSSAAQSMCCTQDEVCFPTVGCQARSNV